jgi:hypothetical protein
LFEPELWLGVDAVGVVGVEAGACVAGDGGAEPSPPPVGTEGASGVDTGGGHGGGGVVSVVPPVGTSGTVTPGQFVCAPAGNTAMAKAIPAHATAMAMSRVRLVMKCLLPVSSREYAAIGRRGGRPYQGLFRRAPARY